MKPGWKTAVLAALIAAGAVALAYESDMIGGGRMMGGGGTMGGGATMGGQGMMGGGQMMEGGEMMGGGGMMGGGTPNEQWRGRGARPPAPGRDAR